MKVSVSNHKIYMNSCIKSRDTAKENFSKSFRPPKMTIFDNFIPFLIFPPLDHHLSWRFDKNYHRPVLSITTGWYGRRRSDHKSADRQLITWWYFLEFLWNMKLKCFQNFNKFLSWHGWGVLKINLGAIPNAFQCEKSL